VPASKAADGAQLVNVQHQADQPGSAAAAAPAPNNTLAAVPLAGLAVEIAARAQSGRNHFEIRLDPPELGKIHVSLDVDKSGQVTSRLVVDRAETLDALRRDAANLERALQDAGLKTGDNGMQFTLRDQSFAGRDEGFTPASMARLVVPDPELATVEAAAGYGPLTRAGGGVDIRV
jgi:flagellar hook-length control protein FliK